MYFADLLFEWRRDHGQAIAERVGERGDLLRQKRLSSILMQFEECSYLAKQIVIDKPDYWEFKLTAELLRGYLSKVRERWDALRNQPYSKETCIVSLDDLADWQSSKCDEMVAISETFSNLINSELHATWGAPGEEGDAEEILRVCKLIYEACIRVVECEESIRFAYLGDEFDEVKEILAGTTTSLIEQTERIPLEISKVFDTPNPTGTYKITLEYDVTEEFKNDYLPTSKPSYLMCSAALITLLGFGYTKKTLHKTTARRSRMNGLD